MTTWSLCKDPGIVLDIAHWQGSKIPWSDARALGVRGVIAKTWHGAGVVKSNVEQLETARAAAMPLLGRYGWFLPDSDLKAQVAAWTSIARASDEIVLTIDHEEPGTQLRGRELVNRLEFVIEAASDKLGERPVVYTGEWYWKGFCGDIDSQIVAECPLHLAAYPQKSAMGTRYQEAVAEVCGGIMPRVPRPWRDRGIEPISWQFDGDRGLYLPHGVDVDVNVVAWERLFAMVKGSPQVTTELLSRLDSCAATPLGWERPEVEHTPIHLQGEADHSIEPLPDLTKEPSS